MLPGGPADGVLEPGDVLLALNGRPLLDFTGLEACSTHAVGGRASASGSSGPGRRTTLEATVQDLHAITPAGYLELSGAVLHPLSFQLARSYGVPVAGILLASRGYAFARADMPPRAVIREIGDVPVPDLAALERELSSPPARRSACACAGRTSAGRELPQESVLRDRPALVRGAALHPRRRRRPIRLPRARAAADGGAGRARDDAAR